MSATALRHQAKPFDVALINTDRRERIQLTPLTCAEFLERVPCKGKIPADLLISWPLLEDNLKLVDGLGAAVRPFANDAAYNSRTQGNVIMEGNSRAGLAWRDLEVQLLFRACANLPAWGRSQPAEALQPRGDVQNDTLNQGRITASGQQFVWTETRSGS
jgi:hypothetical protein